MGLIKVIPQDAVTGLPEDAGQALLIGGEPIKLEVSGTGVLTLNFTTYGGDVTYTITYTSTAGDIPTDAELFDAWAPVVGACNGASGPAVNAPVVSDVQGTIIYPAIS